MVETSYPIVIDSISKKLVQYFKNNLSSIILYGSSQEKNDFWDLDLIVILKKKDSVINDLLFLKKITHEFGEETLDLQLFYSEEISSAEMFSLDAHGAFFSKILASATVLYGENPFSYMVPGHEAVVTSLINRIQRYVFQARQEYLGRGRHNKDNNPLYHQKHLRRALFDLMFMYTSCVDDKHAEKLFREYFPAGLSSDDWIFLESESDDIVKYIALYEKIYNIAIESAHILLPRERKRLQRESINDVVFEYCLPENYSLAIIVLDGLPRTPELSSFLNLLCSWGYAAFYPRLKGTWESGGEFLDHNPAEDIQKLAHSLKSGIVLQGKNFKVDHVLVLGSSFGGLVALNTSLSEDITSVIALSPVYSMSEVSGIETLDSFIKEVFSDAYRYSNQNWKKLLNDELISFDMLSKDPMFNPSKCTVVAGEEDNQVKISELSTICKKYGITTHKLPIGHLSFHKDITTIRPLLYKLIKERS